MQYPSEHELSEWLSELRKQISDVYSTVIPYKYTSEGIIALGKDVSLRYIKMAIFGASFQFLIALILSIYIFPEKSAYIMIASLYLGAYYSYYLLAKKRFNEKWGLIEKLEDEADEWKNNIHLSDVYMTNIKPIIFSHIKIFAMNNYQSMKEILVNNNTDTSNGRHFILMRDSIENDLLVAHKDLSHFHICNAINSTARNKVLELDKEAWTKNQPGAVNLVMSEKTNDVFQLLEEMVSKIIDTTRIVCESNKSSNHLYDYHNSFMGEEKSNIVPIFSANKNNGNQAYRKPQESIYLDVCRLMGLIVDIIDPLISRYRLTTATEETEKQLLAQTKTSLENLSYELSETHRKARRTLKDGELEIKTT